jgi:MurNAc alpha-1-phosphate uridylyltransferase
MKAMIFSAGLGTRFKPWTDKHPKALALVNGKTLLQRNIEYLQEYGINEVIVNVHHFAQQVIDILEENKGWGSKIIISDEQDELLDTGGGLLKAKRYFNEGEPFITCNVDILTDLNINELLEFHREQQPLISFGITRRKTSRNFLFDGDDRLCGWINNTTGETKIRRQSEDLVQKAYSCVVVFEYGLFDKIQYSGKFSLTDLYLDLAATERILGYDHTGDRWVDVGKTESVAIAASLFP